MTDTAAGVERLEFGLEYDGPALETHEMDVRQLAPALLSAATLVRTLNRLARPVDPEVTVNIRATSEGSFLIQLALLYEHALGVLGNPATAGLEGLLTLVVAIIGLRRERGRSGNPVSVLPLAPGTVRVTFPDGTVLEAPADAIRLLDDPGVAKPLQEVVRPLSQAGIERVLVRRQETVLAEVTREDLAAFDEWRSDDREVLSDTEREVFLTIRNVVFDPSLKWRFSDGIANFAAQITDPDFNARVAAREPFASGDVLRCLLRTVQWRDSVGELRSDVEVVRVLEHLPPPSPAPRLFDA